MGIESILLKKDQFKIDFIRKIALSRSRMRGAREKGNEGPRRSARLGRSAWRYGRLEVRRTEVRPLLRPNNHDLSGFDKGGGGVTGLEVELARGVGGDDGRDALIADGENDLCHEAVDDDFSDRAPQLITAADATCASGRGAGVRLPCGEELLQLVQRNAVMAAWRFDGLNATGQNPVLEGGVADADFFRCLARR